MIGKILWRLCLNILFVYKSSRADQIIISLFAAFCTPRIICSRNKVTNPIHTMEFEYGTIEAIEESDDKPYIKLTIKQNVAYAIKYRKFNVFNVKQSKNKWVVP